MKKPGSMAQAQKRRPNRSIKKIAGIVPKRREPPPTRDMKTDCLESNPTWFIRVAM